MQKTYGLSNDDKLNICHNTIGMRFAEDKLKETLLHKINQQTKKSDLYLCYISIAKNADVIPLSFIYLFSSLIPFCFDR